MGCGSSNTSKEPVPVSSDPVQVDDLPISEEILGKIDTATEVHGKIADGMEKRSSICLEGSHVSK